MSALDGLDFRPAVAGDASSLVDLRIEFMRIVKDGGLADEEEWRAELGRRFAEDLESGRLVAWLCLAGGRVVAASGLSPIGPAGRRREALVLNMYTAPPWRRRGIAAFLLGRIVEEARARGYERLRLQPTDDGKPLYRGAGFRDEGRDMVMDLGPRRPREGGHS